MLNWGDIVDWLIDIALWAVLIAVVSIATLIGWSLWGAPAEAQSANCRPRPIIVALLSDRYGESLLGRGLMPSGLMLELFAAPSGTWTLVVSQPDGVSCMTAAEEAWHMPAPADAIEGDPT